MSSIVYLLFFVSFYNAESAIHNVNETVYNTWPKLFNLDDYDACKSEPNWKYCVVDANLISKQPTPLWNLLKEYSADYVRHYNHTQIHRGVCLSKCSGHEVIHEKNQLEKCLNYSVYEEFGLNVQISEVNYCMSEETKSPIDTLDIIVAVVYLLLIFLNFWGTVYDLAIVRTREKGRGNDILLAFSIVRNWRKLTSDKPHQDSRMNAFKSIHGLRAMTLACVCFSHITLIYALSYVENPQYVEMGYDDPLKQLLYNGNIVVQTFFTISAFMVSYNYLIHLEKRKFSLMDYPRGVLNRWLRLTPTYMLILATLQTWMARAGDGALWQHLIGKEKDACRQYWWLHFIYLNNYSKEDVHCMPQSWYLASDMQLFLWGLALSMLAYKTGKPLIVWTVAIIVSLVPTFVHTYYDNLEAVVIQTPESLRNLYTLPRDGVFREIYIPGHTNAGGYTLALASAALYYHWQKNGFTLKGNKLHLTAFYLAFPLGVLLFLSGGIWYNSDWHINLIWKATYATFYKPVYVILLLIILFGLFFKIERLYRGVLSARHWRVLGRVSYCGFLVHTLIQRPLFAIYTKPINMNDYHVLVLLAATIVLTFVIAILLAVTVEMPLCIIQKLLTGGRKPNIEVKTPVPTIKPLHNGELHSKL